MISYSFNCFIRLFEVKISKLVLAFILSGMVGNVFAQPTKISCTVKLNILGKNTYHIEFDDNKRKSIFVNRNEIEKNDYGNYSNFGDNEDERANLISFDDEKLFLY